MCGSSSRSAGKAWQNLRQPMPLAKKLRLLTENVWIRVVRRQDCCGHPGEPGC